MRINKREHKQYCSLFKKVKSLKQLQFTCNTMATLLYIAIDFGTSYSGYAFSFKCDKNREQIRIPPWGLEHGQKTYKTPTCILFDEEQNFLKFGYDALKTYTVSMKRDQAKEHYIFEHFKMELYNKVSTFALVFTFIYHIIYLVTDVTGRMILMHFH